MLEVSANDRAQNSWLTKFREGASKNRKNRKIRSSLAGLLLASQTAARN